MFFQINCADTIWNFCIHFHSDFGPHSIQKHRSWIVFLSPFVLKNGKYPNHPIIWFRPDLRCSSSWTPNRIWKIWHTDKFLYIFTDSILCPKFYCIKVIFSVQTRQSVLIWLDASTHKPSYIGKIPTERQSEGRITTSEQIITTYWPTRLI